MSHLQRSDGGRKKKRTFDEYVEDQARQARQSLWLIKELQCIMSAHSDLLVERQTKRSIVLP